ncbi:hypothetical protein QR680_004131 [Steinernema hermaphroditum]|uniref:Uncharacterized protein n=1 Tax=Steinernema hermaphroditum TaxID=289476 RepID=A0AA39HQ07_9BILA|nr:hypothetical protein QR680_004131 [Steinernema hermaphroditum]
MKYSLLFIALCIQPIFAKDVSDESRSSEEESLDSFPCLNGGHLFPNTSKCSCPDPQTRNMQDEELFMLELNTDNSLLTITL